MDADRLLILYSEVEILDRYIANLRHERLFLFPAETPEAIRQRAIRGKALTALMHKFQSMRTQFQNEINELNKPQANNNK